MKSLYSLIAILGCVGLGRAQNFNVDIDTNAPPELGGGVPSSSFGAAANQPGVWHSLGTNSNAAWLFDLNGIVRPVSVTTATPSGNLIGGGFRNETNTGNYAKLLNDAAHIDGVWRCWTFNGLMNGTYSVVCYAVQYSSQFSRAEVHVSNSLVPNPQIVQGVMPGNQLILGVTHSAHTALVTDGSLEIKVFKGLAPDYPMVNGFQLTLVPEPTTVIFLSAALTGFISRKRFRQ
jgi:hypothetical protein